MTQTKIFDNFIQTYRSLDDIKTVFCPYRICPLGAHVDHQNGLVSGLALDKGIHIVYAPTHSPVVKVRSLNFGGFYQFDLNNIPKKQGDWADYLRGAAASLKKFGELQTGIECVIQGELPIGGLASSAAVIIAFLKSLARANGIRLMPQEIIQTALAAETDYVGIHVGKMDQSCEVYGRKDHLLFMDMKDDSMELIPDSFSSPYEIAVFFSGVQRTLVGSAFNQRVDELKAAAFALMSFAGIEYGKFADARLRDVPVEIYERYKARLPESWQRRAAHYFSEVDRVAKGAEAWRRGDLDAFGRLIFASGRSSIENYQTGSAELKALYEIMTTTDGIYGGRFSGAGFKGSSLALIDPLAREKICESVRRRYLEIFPQYKESFSIHICRSSDGTDALMRRFPT